jgi:hypothetical protein
MGWRDWLDRGWTKLQAVLANRSPGESRPEQVGGRTLEEWEKGWRRIGLLSSAHVTAPRETAGLFRLRLGQEIVYLGRSNRANAHCLRRTLHALTRDPAHSSPLAQLLRQRGHELAVEILITANEGHARQLQERWLQRQPPVWNPPRPPVPDAQRLPPAARRLYPG